jgi:protease-4
MSKTINSYLKTIFFIIVIIQFAPYLWKNVQTYIEKNKNPKNKIGLVIINSPIYSSTEHIKNIRSFFKDVDIKGIIIKLDCPGGAAGSSQALMQEIESLKAQHPKPIVAYVENMCASGGYYVAAATDHIVATGSAIIGSIGSRISTQFKVKKLLEKYDVTIETIASGKDKTLLDPFCEMSEQHREALQSLSDDTYQQFISDIAERRHLAIETSSTWAEGKIFTGKQALNLKLIDEIGNFSTAINFIKKHIIPGDRPVELVSASQKNIVERWLQQPDESFDAKTRVTLVDHFFNKLVQFLESPRLFNS